MNYAETDETLASEAVDSIVIDLQHLVNDSDDATVEDVLARLEEMIDELRTLASGYRIDEHNAETKRWAQCEIDIKEGRAEGWADLDSTLQSAFRHFGPEGERCSPWDRTLAEPWRSIAEVWPRKPTRV